MAASAREQFIRAIDRPEEDIDLARAALLFAKEEYPDLDVDAYIERLDRMAQPVAADNAAGPKGVVDALNSLLFDQEGFEGNAEDYYDPRNSFLNEVLDRKLGIPISLSLLYMELGKRVGLPLAGVGMPGHFLLKPPSARDEWYVDVYNRGRLLSIQECAERIDHLYNGNVAFQPDFLATVNKKQILFRMLANLKGIYLNQQDHGKALATIDRMLLLDPGSVEQVRDRGLVLARLQQHPQAIAELQRYLALQPDAPDAASVSEVIDSTWRRIGGLN